VLSISTQELSAVDLGADGVVGWDDSASKLTYLAAADARTALDVDQAGTDNSTDVTLGASLTDVLGLSTQALSAVDAGAADAFVAWDDSEAKLTYFPKATALAALNVEDGADVTDATNVNSAGAVMEADYDANTILAATADNTPAALTVTEQTLVGRITAGNIAALSATQVRTLLNVEDGATADQTASEFKLDDLAAPDDNTDLNASTTAHGLAPKAVAPSAGNVAALGIANGETAFTNKVIFQGCTTIAVVDALPGTPDSTTLYFVY
jgi:hypothetical protein